MGAVRTAPVQLQNTIPLGNQLGAVRTALLYSASTATSKHNTDLIDLNAQSVSGLVWALYVQRPCRAPVQHLNQQCNPKCKRHGILILGCNQQTTCKKRYKYIMNKHTKKNTQHTKYKGMHEKCVCATKSLQRKPST